MLKPAMQQRLSLTFLLNDTRSRVYLLWAVLVSIGFVASHYGHQTPQLINMLWVVLSVVGLGYMLRVMPMKVRQMRRIVLAWALPIIIGMIISVVAVNGMYFTWLLNYLGVFWLLVMAVGYGCNGLVDRPLGWYAFAVVVHVAAATLCVIFDAFTAQQYLLAAIVSVWSLVNLWLFRT
jgi:hypothetical protein